MSGNTGAAAALPLASNARAGAWLLGFVRPTRAHLVFAMLLFALAAAAGLVLPFALGRLVDAVERGDRSAVLPVAVAALAGLAAAALLAAAAAIVLTFTLESVLARVRASVAAAALGLPGNVADAVPTGELTSRGSDDVDALREAVSGPIPTLATSLAAIGVTLAGLLALHPWFFVAVLAVVPVHVFAVRAYLRRAPGLYRGARAAVARRSAGLYEALRSREAIRAFGSDGRVRELLSRRSWAVLRSALVIRIVQSRFFLRLGLGEMVGTVALLFTGFALVNSGAATTGQATTALLVMLALFAPMSNLLLVIDDLLAASAALRRVVGLVDAAEVGHEQPAGRREGGAGGGAGGAAGEPAPAAAGAPAATPTDAPAGASDVAVELRDVTLALGGTTVLREVSVTVPHGQVVAIVGASGAGKTSLARLIAGHLLAESGEVRVHGSDTGALRSDAAARLVTVLDQHPHVFGATLAENLRLAHPGASDDEVREIAERVGWDADIGDSLSDADVDGALTQRLAIGRALLRRAPVMIFDEATAGADGVQARELDALIRAACVGRTVLLIAHRLSQADACDRILVMDRGRIVEDGAPGELRAAGGVYARLWDAWAAGSGGDA